jgi:serine/threonine-protein kinase
MFVCAECGASQPMQGPCIADGSPLQPVGDDMLLGKTIGAYRVARLLGIGGMGRVYKGVHPQIGSRVAIKVLSRECSDRRDLVDRFFSEAKAVNLIRHESIVNVLDLATLPDGRPYIVMEYLDGAPLSGIIEHAQHMRTPIPLGGLARLVAEVLDALGAAHAKGIIHRDLKPDNIYVTPSGRPKVLDFGIAKLQPELGGSATHTGSLLGTPHYMSPEQAAGRPVDLRADIYAIGVILFECATLHKPFVADSLFDLLRKHVEAPPPSPRALRPDMPPPLEQIIYTALAKTPDQRFASTVAMSMALQHATMALPPEQWAPLVPPNSTRSSQQGQWQPSMPASWAGKRVSVATGPTETEGQVTQRDKAPSKKGLWIALGALLLVGGGVTAAVLASGGGKPGEVIAHGSGSEAGSEAGSAAAPGGDPWGAPGEAGSAAPQPVAPPMPPPATDDDEDAADVAQSADEVADEVFMETLDLLPPIARKDIDAAVKKYGSWSRIPAKERTRLMTKLAERSTALSQQAANDINSALSGNRPTPPPQAPPQKQAPKGELVENERFGVPNYNPRKLDIQKYLTYALAEAKKHVPDAVLFRIDADGVYPAGYADITLEEDASLDFRFISPSRSKKDPSIPLGVKQEMHCMFRIMFDAKGGWRAPMFADDKCDEPTLGPPKCSVVEVWKKAAAAGAPANAVAELGYRGWQKKAKWYFSIEGTDFSEVFTDDCR